MAITFEQHVEEFCRQMCVELGQEVSEWKQHEAFAKDWLLREAVMKVGTTFWRNMVEKGK